MGEPQRLDTQLPEILVQPVSGFHVALVHSIAVLSDGVRPSMQPRHDSERPNHRHSHRSAGDALGRVDREPIEELVRGDVPPDVRPLWVDWYHILLLWWHYIFRDLLPQLRPPGKPPAERGDELVVAFAGLRTGSLRCRFG